MTRAWLGDAAAARLLGQLLATDAMIEAIYTPPTWGAVPSWAAPLVGRRCRWITRFRFESGPHAGQRAMAAMGVLRLANAPGDDEALVPLGHLSEVALVCVAGGDQPGVVLLHPGRRPRRDADDAGKIG